MGLKATAYGMACLVAQSWCSPALAYAETRYPVSQGWNQQQMETWYELSQGSRLIPWDWVSALAKPDGTPMLDRKALEGLGYIYMSDATDSLPVGFVLDRERDKSWLGFNCSACHTAKLKAGTAEILVHGGQSMADFQTFTTGLIAAVENLTKDSDNFERFAAAILGEHPQAKQKRDLMAEIVMWLDRRMTINATGKDSHWGRGRADAVGIILATTAYVVARKDLPDDERERLPASNAPVSYPFVWNANQQGRLQHNGVVDNGVNLGLVKVAKIGALIRNWTEALGVFADVQMDEKADKVITSINMDNILLMEQALAELQSPQWPQSFGALDEVKRLRGEKLYKVECGSCHGLLEATDTQTELPLIDIRDDKRPQPDPKGFVYLQPVFDKTTRPSAFDKAINPKKDFIGTDPGMACNSLTHTVPSGVLEGQTNVRGFVNMPGNEAFADRAVTTDLLRVLIQRDIMAHKTDSLMTIAENQYAAAQDVLRGTTLTAFFDGILGKGTDEDPLAPLRRDLKNCATLVEFARTFNPENPVPVYKARPLNGIWATAPYLHNGSVPSLHDLLLPQPQRPARFGYLFGDMDVEKVGLKDASANPAAFILDVYNKDGQVITGNWNGGHEYGTSLSHEQRMDLIEYVKGL